MHAARNIVGVLFAKDYVQGVGTRICDGELEAGDVERGESLLQRITNPFRSVHRELPSAPSAPLSRLAIDC